MAITPSRTLRKQGSKAKKAANGSSGRNGKVDAREAHIGLADKDREGVRLRLRRFLADQHVLYQKTRLMHWNLEGSRFDPLHRLFEEQYEAVAAGIDAVAERIRMLDGTAPAAMRELVRLARLGEIDARPIDGDDAIALLLADHEALVRTLRDDIGSIGDEFDDAGTADLLTGLLREHEKTAWMLRSHLRR